MLDNDRAFARAQAAYDAQESPTDPVEDEEPDPADDLAYDLWRDER